MSSILVGDLLGVLYLRDLKGLLPTNTVSNKGESTKHRWDWEGHRGGIHGRPTGRRGLWPGTCQQVPALPVSPLRHEAPRDPRGQGAKAWNRIIQGTTTVGFGENVVCRGRRLGLEVCTLDLTCRRQTKWKAPQKRDQSENNWNNGEKKRSNIQYSRPDPTSI